MVPVTGGIDNRLQGEGMDQWINLYRASHSLEAPALKGALEVEGVLVRLNGEALSGALVGFA